MEHVFEKDGKWFADNGEELNFIPETRKKAHLTSAVGEIVAKICSPCNRMLTIDNFGSDKRGLAGKRGFCKVCDKLRQTNNEKGLDVYGNPKKDRPKSVKRYYNDRGEVIAKVCTSCGELKSIGDFYPHISATDGLSIHCRQCHVKGCVERARANPEQYKTYSHNRRAKERALPGDLTEEQWTSTLDFFDYSCALTGATEDITLEHSLPIFIGHGGTTYWNCYPLAKSLNSSKQARNLFEWARARDDIDKRKFNRLITFLADQCGLTVDEYRIFYYWCFANPRLTVEEIEADGDVDSLTLWRRSQRKNT